MSCDAFCKRECFFLTLRIVAEIKLPSNWDAVHRPASRGVLNLRQTFITENIVAASALRQSCIVSGFIEQPRPFAYCMQNRKNGKSVFAQSIFEHGAEFH